MSLHPIAAAGTQVLSWSEVLFNARNGINWDHGMYE